MAGGRVVSLFVVFYLFFGGCYFCFYWYFVVVGGWDLVRYCGIYTFIRLVLERRFLSGFIRFV